MGSTSPRLGAMIAATLLLVVALAGAARAAPLLPPLPHFHAMPCQVGATPDRLLLRWSTQRPGQPDRRGGREFRGSASNRTYHVVCAIDLVTYDRPTAISCPNATAFASYYLAFLHHRKLLLSVIERVDGCTFLSVEGVPKLGRAYINPRLVLPPGIPVVP